MYATRGPRNFDRSSRSELALLLLRRVTQRDFHYHAPEPAMGDGYTGELSSSSGTKGSKEDKRKGLSVEKRLKPDAVARRGLLPSTLIFEHLCTARPSTVRRPRRLEATRYATSPRAPRRWPTGRPGWARNRLTGQWKVNRPPFTLLHPISPLLYKHSSLRGRARPLIQC